MQAIIPEGQPTHLADGTPIDPQNYLLAMRDANGNVTSVGRQIDETKLSLWNDIRWDRAKSNMSKEQLNQYKSIGEQMNGSIDYVSGKSNPIPIPEPVKESLSYILSGLKSGLDVDDLDEDEIKTLETFIGEDWRSKIFVSEKKDDSDTQNTNTDADNQKD
tara:strand:- start:5406 stop:5888 length:483 start_codon:yes stop_codon:yes gene_type:complete